MSSLFFFFLSVFSCQPVGILLHLRLVRREFVGSTCGRSLAFVTSTCAVLASGLRYRAAWDFACAYCMVAGLDRIFGWALFASFGLTFYFSLVFP